jgi:cell division protein FtsQ
MKFKKVIGSIVVALLVTAAAGYAVFSLMAFSSVEQQVKCRDLEIRIEAKLPLFTEDELHLMLRDEGLHPIGLSMRDLSTERIERYLEAHPYVKKVRCYHDPNGKVLLELVLRTPHFLVMGNENYYVDDEGNQLPAKPGVMAYVPVVTGRVTKSMLQNDLYKLVDYVARHDFWNAQIQQIHVRDDQKIELVPRVGDALIVLGSAHDYELKLGHLFRLYHQAFNVMGWNSYRLLDLQFENQIVAIRNEEASATRSRF